MTDERAPEFIQPPVESAATRASPPAGSRLRFPTGWLAALLALVTVVLYWPATHHSFINCDDDVYVASNVDVQGGLTPSDIRLAFTRTVGGNWHPVTMLSHMLDCEIFGVSPGGHHLTSLLLHALNTVLVFLLLHRLTGAVGRSFLVAALFGWHPVHVESVAWVAERKDVLSTCFGLLTLWFYARYARDAEGRGRRPEDGGQTSEVRRSFYLFPAYWLAWFCFALGLMSKPMLVTWPFVLLLVDYWPLARWKPGAVWPLVREKLPFLALAAASSLVTFLVQNQVGAVVPVKSLPLELRCENALISYTVYLQKMFWPADLAIFYPHYPPWPGPALLLAGGLLGGLTVLLFWWRRRHPFLLTGWLWFGGTLVPVIGLVQVGDQAMADRYLYVPSLGLLILTVWGGYELTRRWRWRVSLWSVTGAAAALACLVLTRQQLGYWQNSETLFRHALRVTKNNYSAHNSLAIALASQGRIDEAIGEFREAIRLNPFYSDACDHLGITLANTGHTAEAIAEYREAIRLNPRFIDARNNLGIALASEGRVDEAINEYGEALQLNPRNALVRDNLGIALGRRGQADLAMEQFQAAVRLSPGYVEAHNNLGIALARMGQIDEAIDQFQDAVRLDPKYTEAKKNLAMALELKDQPGAAP